MSQVPQLFPTPRRGPKYPAAKRPVIKAGTAANSTPRSGLGGRNDDGVHCPPTKRSVQDRNDLVISAVDAIHELSNAGITFIDSAGRETEIRGGPRQKWVYISAARVVQEKKTDEESLPTFWDRWGDSVLNCSSAVATGTVISLSGGSASLVVGAFAVNSAALCGMSLGKAIEYDAWQEFEKNGGGVYKVWLTTETAMSLADLLSGVKGAVGFLKAWNKTGKLAKLQKAVSKQKLSRKQLLKVIQKVDPSFKPNLAAAGKAGYYSKAKLYLAGKNVLDANKFKSLSNQQARELISLLGDSITVSQTKDAISAVEKTLDVWLVQYKDESENE